MVIIESEKIYKIQHFSMTKTQLYFNEFSDKKKYSQKYLSQKFSTSICVQITTKLMKTEICGAICFFRVSPLVDLICGPTKTTMWTPITL